MQNKSIICPFCEVITKHSEGIIRETKNTFTILSNPRLVPDHLLIIPKHHVEKFSELTLKERVDLFGEAIRLEEIVLDKLAPGCDLSQHYRPFVKQSRLKVNHLHIHLRPRKFKDHLYKKVQKHEIDIFTNLKPGELNRYKKIFTDI